MMWQWWLKSGKLNWHKVFRCDGAAAPGWRPLQAHPAPGQPRGLVRDDDDEDDDDDDDDDDDESDDDEDDDDINILCWFVVKV